MRVLSQQHAYMFEVGVHLSFGNIIILRTMYEDRITGQPMLHIHCGAEVDLETIIAQFTRKHPRRMQLVNILI